MKVNNYFERSRFSLLLKLELFKSKQAIVMTLVIAFGLLFLVGFLLDIITSGKARFDHDQNFLGSFMLGGFVLSSLSFNDLSNPLKRQHYLTLPVSTFEKFFSMWLLTSIGWTILFTVIFTLYTYAANAVGHLIFPNVTFTTFDPFGNYSLNTIRYYFVLQGVFMVGAVHFREYVLPKTLFTLVIFTLVSAILGYFIMQESFLMEHECSSAGECEVLQEISVHPVWRLVTWLFWWAFAPLCWVITYLGLKENER